MAKQVGPIFFTGTIDGLIFYKLGDNYYTRAKGSYKSAKHMRKNPKYKRTMQKADQFGQASKITQEVYYRHLSKAARKQGLYGQLTGIANRLLQTGKSQQEVKQALIVHCQTLEPLTTPATTVPDKEPHPPIKTKTPSSVSKPIIARPITKVKKARYLSRWKVKPNGRLHIPKRSTSSSPPPIKPLCCQV